MDRERIGVFDSGVGGLGVWSEVARAVPGALTVYWADQAHVPYGGKPFDALQARAQAAVRVLRANGARVIVVACNTATAVSLATLRREHPDIAFVGMEPAVKPAAAASKTGVIGVLATRTTLEAPGFQALLARHAGSVRVVARAGIGLVEAVEAGETSGARLERCVEACVAPMLAEDVDQLVLGCTHYPFLRTALATALGPGVTIVDPAPAVARRTAHLWRQRRRRRPDARDHGSGPRHLLLTSGDPEAFARAFRRWYPGTADARIEYADASAPPGPAHDTEECRQKT